MRAAVIEENGGTPVVREFDEPAAGDGRAVATVLAASLNPADILTARGLFGPPPQVPYVAGLEGVGTLEDGRRVYFGRVANPFGSLAERALIDPAATLAVPDGLDPADAVALGIAGLAGWLPVAHHAQLKGGERVLVLGATGAAGRIAVQAARRLGAGVVVAAGRERDELAWLLEHGADAVAVLAEDAGAALAVDKGDGYDVVIDYVFGDAFLAALGHSARGARLIVVGSGAGPVHELTFGALQGRTVIGHGNQLLPLATRQVQYDALAAEVLAGRIVVELERLPLDRAPEAWERQAAGTPRRKLVIVP